MMRERKRISTVRVLCMMFILNTVLLLSPICKQEAKAKTVYSIKAFTAVSELDDRKKVPQLYIDLNTYTSNSKLKEYCDYANTYCSSAAKNSIIIVGIKYESYNMQYYVYLKKGEENWYISGWTSTEEYKSISALANHYYFVTSHSHADGKLIEGQSNCVSDGYKSYYQCDSSCGKYFMDKEGTKEITDLEAWKKDSSANGGFLPKSSCDGTGWIYDVEGEKLVYHCSNGWHNTSATLQKDSSSYAYDYNGSPKSVKLNLKANWPEEDALTQDDIVYYLEDGTTMTNADNSGAISDGKPPVFAGTYIAKITSKVDTTKTASLEFKVNKKTRQSPSRETVLSLIDFDKETYDNTNYEFSLDNGDTIEKGNTLLPNRLYYVRQKEERNYKASGWYWYTSPKVPVTSSQYWAEAPTNKDGSDGKITNLADGLEYQLAGQDTWIKVEGNTITGLKPGKLYYRVAATNECYKGQTVEAVVPNAHSHSDYLKKQPSKETSCMAAGWKESYCCQYCSACFEDKECTNRILFNDYENWKTKGAGKIDRLEHNLSYSVSGDTLTATCNRMATKHTIKLSFKLHNEITQNEKTRISHLCYIINSAEFFTNTPTIPVGVDDIELYKVNTGGNKTRIQQSKEDDDINLSAGDYLLELPVTIPVEDAASGTTVDKQYILSKKMHVYSGKASVSTDPKAITSLRYNGRAQTLLVAGKATNGYVGYSFYSDKGFSKTIPTATDIGTYTVYYKAVGAEKDCLDSEVRTIKVSIGKGNQTKDKMEISKTYNLISVNNKATVQDKLQLPTLPKNMKYGTISVKGRNPVSNPIIKDGIISYQYQNIPTGKYDSTISIPVVEKSGTVANYNDYTMTVYLHFDVKNNQDATNMISSKLKVKSGKNVTVSWGKVPGATSYKVYMGYAGKKKLKVVKTINSSKKLSAKINKINGKKVDKKKNIVCYVEAYAKVNGKLKIVGKSIPVYVVGAENKSNSEVKKITLKKTSYSLKVGKTATIQPKVVKKNSKLPLIKGVSKFRYTSSNPDVATVSKKGKIKVKRKGTAYIYVYSSNGLSKKITVKGK